MLMPTKVNLILFIRLVSFPNFHCCGSLWSRPIPLRGALLVVSTKPSASRADLQSTRCNSGASGKNRVTARPNVAGAKKLREL